MSPGLGRRTSIPDRSVMRTAMIGTVTAIVAGIAAFAWWANTPLGPEPPALDALRSDATVTVSAVAEGWLFVPVDQPAPVGLVLYPGGRVDARSYAPLARLVAEGGYTVALAAMPLNLAVFDPDRALELMDAAPSVTTWAVGGHSLGGAMAAAFAASGEPRVGGLVLLGAYPAESTDVSEQRVAVLSVIGDADEVVETETWEASAERLPADATYLVIEGGNHAGFGDYGDQPGDGTAALPPGEQQRLTAEAVLALLDDL